MKELQNVVSDAANAEISGFRVAAAIWGSGNGGQFHTRIHIRIVWIMLRDILRLLGQ